MPSLSENEFNFNGYNSYHDMGLIMQKVAIPIAPTMTESVADIPGKYGNEFYGMNYSSKQIDIPVTAMDSSWKEFQEHMILLGDILINLEDELGTEYPITFGANPDVTYWGHWTAIGTPAFIGTDVFDTSFTLSFTMSDPRGYYPQRRYTLSGKNLNPIMLEGNTTAESVIHIIPKRSLSYFGYIVNGGQFGVGPDDAIGQATVKERLTAVMTDTADTMAVWSQDADLIRGITSSGTQTNQGEMISRSATSSIIVRTSKDDAGNDGFGVHRSDYYGPVAVHDGLETNLTAFHVETWMHHYKYFGSSNGRAIGSVETLLLNPTNQTIARLTIRDNSGGKVPYLLVQFGLPGTKFVGGDRTHESLINTGSSGQRLPLNRNDKDVWTQIDRKTKKVTTSSTKKSTSKYMNVQNAGERTALSDFWGKIMIEKDTNNVWTASVTQYDTGTGHKATWKGAYNANRRWVDSKKKYASVTLSTIAIVMQKHSITEDDQKVAYKVPFMSISGVNIYRVNDVDPDTPDVVAKAGQEIIINTETQQVTVDDVQLQPVWSTDWPKFIGGKVCTLIFAGDIADADIKMDIIPKVK